MQCISSRVRANLFNSIGNYLYCYKCIISSLGISQDRLTRQWNIKRRESNHPVTQTTKSEDEEQNLGKFVMMPPNIELSFTKCQASSQQAWKCFKAFTHF